MIKPPRLRPGDTVAVLSPSWGGPSGFPHVFDHGLRILQETLSLRVKEFPTTRMDAKVLYENPRRRAEDLNAAFADPEVRGIVSAIGGNDSIRLLEFLDLDLILSHPKLIMGYSDTTALLAYLNLRGLGTFYGPSIMAGFAYLENFPEAAQEYRRVLFTEEPYGLRPFPSWADSYQSWGPTSLGVVSQIHVDDVGHRWLQKGPLARGRLWGGCLEVLEMMKATFAWPPTSFWDDKVLFLETSEEKPTPAQVGYALRSYGVQGVLGRLQGLLIGRPKSYSADEKRQLDAEVLKIVVGEFGRRDLSIVTNLDMGHTDPRHLFPYGVELEINPETEGLAFTEPLFDDARSHDTIL